MNAVLTTMILDAALDNDMNTSSDLFTIGLLIFVILAMVISIIFIRFRFKTIIVKKIGVHWVISLCFFFFVFNIPRFKRPVSERIPFNVYFIMKRYIDEKEIALTDRPSLSENIDCSQVPDSLTVVFVIGESLRSDHLGINGYKRNTTPYLFQEDIISYINVYSKQAHTNASIPYIMTRADSLHENRAFQERSFIDLFEACDFRSIWLANQESADTYIYFMHECDSLQYVNMEKSSYVFDMWLDGSLLPLFDNFLQKNNPKNLVILHTIGSHWYYNSHFPEEFKIYQPITKSRIISSSSEEELINSYDNTVVYTDFFLYSLIDRLRNKNAVLIYLSDHGENLGEDNVWLHAVDAPFVHRPACLVWMSPIYKSSHPEKYENAINKRNKHFGSEFLFHSILDVAGIQSPYIEYSQSIFR